MVRRRFLATMTSSIIILTGSIGWSFARTVGRGYRRLKQFDPAKIDRHSPWAG